VVKPWKSLFSDDAEFDSYRINKMLQLGKTESKLTTLVLADPITNATQDMRRHLLFAACASILLTAYKLKIKKTPWLDIEVPEGAPEILTGALSVALIYTLLVFSINAWVDVRRWHLARDLIYVDKFNPILGGTISALLEIDRYLSQPSRADDPAWEKTSSDGIKQSAYMLRKMERLYSGIVKNQRKMAAGMAFRIVFFDIGLPVTLGVFALYKIAPALIPFLKMASN